MRSLTSRILAVVVVALFVAPAVHADVLTKVPSTAAFVIKFQNLSDINTKLQDLSKEMGIVALNPVLSDPLASFQDQTGITAGLNKAGDAAFVIPTVPADGSEPHSLILLPVSDYKAFIGNFKNAKQQDGLDVVQFPNSDKPLSVADWDGYAALSDDPALLKAKPDGLKPTPVAATEFSSKDIVMYMNIKVMAPTFMPKFKEQRDGLEGEMMQAITGKAALDPKMQAIVKVMVHEYVDAIQAFLEQSDSLTISVNFGKNGITQDFVSEFEPGSYCAAKAAALHNSDASFTAPLPDKQFLVFGGVSIDASVWSDIIKNAVGPISAEMQKQEVDPKTLNDYLDAINKTLAAEKTQSFAMVAPTAAPGQGSLVQLVSVTEGDAKAFVDGETQMLLAQDTFMKTLNPASSQTTTVTPSAKEIDGVPFSQFTIAIGGANPTPQEQQQAAIMKMVYGPDGPEGFFGAVDDHHALSLIGISAEAQLAHDALAAAKTDADAVGKSESVQSVINELPKSRIGEVFVPLDVWATTGMHYAGQFGMPVNVKLAPNLPPLGFTLSTEQDGLRVEGYIPAKLVEALVSAGLQLQMQMHGGGGAGGAQPGGPGGL